MSNIQKMAVFVQIDGKAYQVSIPPDRVQLAAHLLSSISDSGKLTVVPTSEISFVTRGAA